MGSAAKGLAVARNTLASDGAAGPGALRPSAEMRHAGERNILLVVVDDLGSPELASYATDLRDAVVAPTSSSAIRDADGDGMPDGLEDDDADGVPDGATATPELDRLAAAGVRFERTWATPLCSPTRASLYTGLYPGHTGVGHIVKNAGMVDGLPADVQTLPERMDAAGSGYATALFGKWHLGADGNLPTDRGWDHFAGRPGGGGAGESHYSWNKTVCESSGGRSTSDVEDYDATVQVDDALAWIADQTGPWWATVAFNAVHSPYEMPPESCVSAPAGEYSDRELFHFMITCLDSEIGRLVDSLSAYDLARTTIIVVGDNGTESPVSGVYTSGRGKSSVFQGGVQVPLLVADGAQLVGGAARSQWGVIRRAGRSVGHPVDVVDVAALIAEISGLGTRNLDGIGLDAYLASPSAESQRSAGLTELFSYDEAELEALVADGPIPSSSDLALLTKTGHDVALYENDLTLLYTDGVYQLFDVSVDPFQQTDVWCRDEDYSTRGLSLVGQLRELDGDFPDASCEADTGP